MSQVYCQECGSEDAARVYDDYDHEHADICWRCKEALNGEGEEEKSA